QFTQGLDESLDLRRSQRVFRTERARQQKADPARGASLLRSRGVGQEGRRGERQQGFAAPHSMTSSACASQASAKEPLATDHHAVQPPSTSRLDPVTSEAAGEARNTTAFATSSTVPRRPRGIRSCTHLLKAASLKNGSVSGVLIKVGAIETTRTLLGASS